MSKALFWICFCCYFKLEVSYGQVWNSLNGKPDDDCFVLKLDSTEKYLLVGGTFTFIDKDSMNGISTYSFNKFEPLEFGIPFQATEDFIYYDGKLIAAGTGNQLYPIVNIGQWDGLHWNKIPISGTVLFGLTISSLEVFQNELYAVGDVVVPGIGGRNIARYDGSSWKGVGGGIGSIGRFPLDMIVFKENLIVAGLFDSASAVKFKNIAAWDGISWKSISKNEINEQINTIEIFDDTLYAGTRYGNIYKLKDSSWTEFANVKGGFEFITKLKSTSMGFAVGGEFDSISGKQASNIALWDGKYWNSLNSGTNGRILGIQEYDNRIAVCGMFTTAGGKSADKIAIWGSPLEVKKHKAEKKSISLHPNPTSGQVVIEMSEISSPEISIFNSMGMLVFSQPYKDVDRIELDLHLPSGIYFVKVNVDGSVSDYKLVVE